MRFPEFADEWKQTTLGELLNFYSTNSYSWDQLDYKHGSIYNVHYGLIHKGLPTICSLDKVKLPFIKEEIDINKYTICKAGDLIIADASEDTDDVGKAIEILECEDKQVVAGLHTIHARSKQCITSLGFKGYLLASKGIKEQIRQVAQGTKVYSISAKLLAPLITSLPSLAEQKKIAGFLSLIDERIESCSETIKEKKREKATLLNQLFSQKLRFPQFSDEWQQTTLGEIAEITSGYSGEQEQMETPYRVSRIETISSGVIDIERVGFVSYDAKLVAYKLSLGDILFSNINSIEHIGKSAIVSRPIDLYHGMNLLRLKAINIDPYVLYYHLQRDVVRNRFRSIANKAVSQASINQTTLGKEPVLLAPTLAEQNKIADFLSLIDERIEVEEALLKQYEMQKKYLLRQMFI